MRRFEERVAVVTGGGRGIGAAVATRLASEGARVAVVDIDPRTAEETGARIGGGSRGFACDVSSPDDVEALHARIAEVYGRIDVLVNAAGLVAHREWDALEFHEWKRVMAVNLDGTYLMCRHSSNVMRKNNFGRIVNIGSSSMYLGSPDMSHYIASKGGVWALGRALATELGRYGITVNTVSPGLTETEGVRASPHMSAFPEIEARQAMPGRALPEKIVPAIVFFASEEAGWITGQSLLVDGGVGRW